MTSGGAEISTCALTPHHMMCPSASSFGARNLLPPSRLVERFLLDNYKPHTLSTYALTLYRYIFKTAEGLTVPVGTYVAAEI